jgi:hypothetical protein
MASALNYDMKELFVWITSEILIDENLPTHEASPFERHLSISFRLPTRENFLFTFAKAHKRDFREFIKFFHPNGILMCAAAAIKFNSGFMYARENMLQRSNGKTE